MSSQALNSQSPVPLYLQIEAAIRDSIDSGELAPLDRVMSETELSDHFGVSRMTARKAVDRLVAEGLLFRQPGKGTFVAKAKIAHGLSTHLSFSAAMDRTGHSHDTRVLQATMVAAPAHVARPLQLLEGDEVVFLRRLRLVDAEPAALHVAYLPSEYQEILGMDLTSSLTQLMSRVGVGVAHARDKVEAVVADTESAQVLGISPGAPLLLIEGVALTTSMKPVRFTEGLYRGDRFRFSLDTTQPADLTPEMKR